MVPERELLYLIENRNLLYDYVDKDRTVEVCEITGLKFRVLIHRLGNSISVWNRMNTEWCFVHSIDGEIAFQLTRDEIRHQLLTVALNVVGTNDLL